jgi:hypothetical protein
MVRIVKFACPALCAAALVVVAPAAVLAHSSRKPVIKGAEVGYFGGATVTHAFSVFVYSNLGPKDGNRVMVCVSGVCKRARGHDAHLAWYSATFSTAGLRMGDSVRYTATASDTAGKTSRTFDGGLLCMHNNGSTPQT